MNHALEIHRLGGEEDDEAGVAHPEMHPDHRRPQQRAGGETRQDEVAHAEDHHRHEAGQQGVDVREVEPGRQPRRHDHEQAQDGPHRKVAQRGEHEPARVSIHLGFPCQVGSQRKT